MFIPESDSDQKNQGLPEPDTFKVCMVSKPDHNTDPELRINALQNATSHTESTAPSQIRRSGTVPFSPPNAN